MLKLEKGERFFLLTMNCVSRNKNHRQLCIDQINFFFFVVPCVYTIADKPILSRARASLPESHLQFGKVDEGKALI